jgi:hypothetical protein
VLSKPWWGSIEAVATTSPKPHDRPGSPGTTTTTPAVVV